MTTRVIATVLLVVFSFSCSGDSDDGACPAGQLIVAGKCQAITSGAGGTGGGSGMPNPGGTGGTGMMGNPGPLVALPFVVDAYYGPSGYMGDGETGGISTSVCPQRGGEMKGMCHRFTWTPGAKMWAGVFWQNPDGYWGTPAGMGLRIAAGARQITFTAWGAVGGEKVSFSTGYENSDGFKRSVDVTLTTTPTAYAVDLAGISYTQVGGGFAWTAANSPTPVTFTVDDIQWR